MSVTATVVWTLDPANPQPNIANPAFTLTQEQRTLVNTKLLDMALAGKLTGDVRDMGNPSRPRIPVVGENMALDGTVQHVFADQAAADEYIAFIANLNPVSTSTSAS